MENIICIQTFASRLEAEFAKSKLEAEGIKSFVEADDAGGAYPLSMSKIKLLIHKKDEKLVKNLLTK